MHVIGPELEYVAVVHHYPSPDFARVVALSQVQGKCRGVSAARPLIRSEVIELIPPEILGGAMVVFRETLDHEYLVVGQ
jgi:hypothetical protein